MLEEILGGGVQSRLMQRVRASEGLTYGISMDISHEGRPGVPGAWRVDYQTRTGQAARSIRCVIEEVERLRREPISDAELDMFREIWKSRRSFFYARGLASVKRLMEHELDDRPADREQQLVAAVEAVTAQDVMRVAQKYLHPAELTVALFGSLDAEDEAAIRARFGLRKLPAKVVFKGGYN